LLALLCLAAPATAETYFEAAQKLYEAGKHTEARRALRNELKIRPDNLEARYDLAVLLEEIGHRKDAIALYEENMRRGWHLPTVVNLSAVYRQQGETDRAVQLLEKAGRKFRHEAVPWYLLAEISLQAGEKKKAEKQFAAALRADPLNAFAHIRYAAFLAGQKQMRAAIKHARRSTGLRPECADCWRILGDILRDSGDHTGALQAYQKSAAIKPDVIIRKRIIRQLQALGEHKRADIMQRSVEALQRSRQPTVP